MAILKIVTEEDAVLRKVCRPVESITPRMQQLIDDMIETLHDSGGVGLAAPQVGVLRRLVIIEVEEGQTLVLINPVITATEGEQEELEGCLSIPGKWGVTKRPYKVTVEALDREGVKRSYTGTELLAKAFCHELDHLDGVLYIDRPDTRMLSKKEIEELIEE